MQLNGDAACFKIALYSAAVVAIEILFSHGSLDQVLNGYRSNFLTLDPYPSKLLSLYQFILHSSYILAIYSLSHICASLGYTLALLHNNGYIVILASALKALGDLSPSLISDEVDEVASGYFCCTEGGRSWNMEGVERLVLFLLSPPWGHQSPVTILKALSRLILDRT